ncbi:hypothetical protein IVB18_18040 [Bradyrhizobium sp. 186]|uniref:hypothetical protein n=1 Tax=Bradyrhizobium sp. 186 TaxID=2782654 RepID=UPI002000C93A|nr:hypothetical protein [Bradyrhizobium sp. 186]UPK38961.1 hypothetical protein IVB18_18040 [Bradyrhizobium sp. 186]
MNTRASISVVSLCIMEYCFFLGVGMAHYRAYLLDQHRHVISVANLQCADEQEARERVQQLVDVNDIELWQLDRRIAVFEPAITGTPKATG